VSGPNEVSRLADAARRAVEEASAVSLGYFRAGASVDRKSDGSPVTQADREAERSILDIVREADASASILAEESGIREGEGGGRWIVDPLDGTRGFARGGPFWGPMVAYERDDAVLAGAIALPALGEVYWAGRGLGSWCGRDRLQVSHRDRWDEATLSLGELGRLLAPPWRDAICALVSRASSTRCYGDLAGCAMLLRGRAEVWVEAGVREWDLAPLRILVEEAGGTFTDFGGGTDLASGCAIASNGRLHPDVLAALNRSQSR
jgi:histidinol-phosphatase